jgi:hypothetical protein
LYFFLDLNVPNWLSVGSSYRAPLVTINTETASKPSFQEDLNTSGNATFPPVYSSQESTTLFSEGKDSSLEMARRDKTERGKKERKYDSYSVADVEVSDRKRKKEKKEKKEKKDKKEKKEKYRNKTDDYGKSEREISKNKIDKEKGKESVITHRRMKNYNNNSSNNNNSNNNNDDTDNNENQHLSDSVDTDDSWSTEGENNTNSKKMKNSQLVNVDHSYDSEKNAKNIIFLPDGKILVTAKSGSELGPKVPGVDWVTDTRGDSSIKTHGYYLPDIPVYKLYTGNIAENHGNSNYEINDHSNNINNSSSSSSSNVRFSIARTNSKFTTSFSLASKTHILPSGAIFSSNNSAIFRPQEKTVLQQKYGKSEILREIRLKKRNRFFMAGKYELGNDGEINSKKTKKLSTDVISDISVKRIHFDILRKRKQQQQIEKQKFIIQNDSGSKIQNTSQNNFPFYPEKSFLNSSFLPFPTHTTSGMEKEFEHENKEVTVKMPENKPNRAAFFGFGNTENVTNIQAKSMKDTEFKTNKTEIEVKKIEKVFLSDAEVKQFIQLYCFLAFHSISLNWIYFIILFYILIFYLFYLFFVFISDIAGESEERVRPAERTDERETVCGDALARPSDEAGEWWKY